MPGSFEEIDHSADTGLKIVGDSPEELFEAGARGMFSLITGIEKIGRSVKNRIEISEEYLDELLMSWFRELLYHFSVEYVLYRYFHCTITKNESGLFVLDSICEGEKYRQGFHDIHTEIKTATYHQFSLTENRGLWEATVIFDL